MPIKIVFWHEQYPKTAHSEVPEFSWINGKRVVRLRAYNVYEITPRAIPNENNEPATYKCPYHLVKQGETWDVIEKEAGVNRYALQWENGLDEATPLDTLVGKKIYFPRGTRKLKPTPKTPSTEPSNKSENKSVNKKASSVSKQEQEQKAEEKKAQNQVMQARSENNGKPVDVVEDENKKKEFDWFETPLVKLIVSKESKGSFNAYNVTGWNDKGKNVIYESHFKPTAQYYIEKMTIAEIRKAQMTEIGKNREHLFAVGIFQMIPSTIFGKHKGDKCFIKWLSNYRNIDETKQLFNREFQQLTPLYFWEDKQEQISLYFMNKTTVEEAAYAVSREWASAATPKNKPTYKRKFISNGYMSYYTGDGMNKAHYSAEQTIQALKDTKIMIEKFGGYNSVREATLLNLNR
ncbi:hypothetical protein [Rodentibacter pneumotropicus]|uniref:hypothetical protein n=1 Tax=Rodentibacter pneumotropicus TaxID=758 RepID=UPI001F616A46|nr:hypothetical protein [Rodentibacter pneumotropicus]